MSLRARALAKAITFTARLLTGVGMQQTGPLPYTDPAVYFANHTSHLDALVLWSALPAAVRSRTRPVAAKDYWTGGPVRSYIATEVLDTVLVERRAPTSASVSVPAADGAGASDIRTPRTPGAVEKMASAVNAGASLILFPEGTRGQRDDVTRFRNGIFHLAAQLPQTDFVPVYLENMNRILPKGEVLPVPLLGRASFGAPLRIIPGEEKPDFLERSRAALMELKEEEARGRRS